MLAALVGARVAAYALVLLAATPTDGQAFRNVAPGGKIENVALRTLAGKETPLLRKESRANVFVFVRPGQEFSEQAVAQIAEAERTFAGKPVHWTVIVSSRADRAAAEAMAASAKLSAPLLVDEGDALWGELGVALHPTAGIADGGFTLRAYEPFNELRFTPRVVAQVRRLLGEIDDAALDAILNPKQSDIDESAAGVSRYLAYAEKMLQAGKLDRALELAREATSRAPASADGHALVAAVLAAQGDCAGARQAAALALKADSANARALEVKAKCGGS